MVINPNVVIIEALPGVGGDESKLWMKELLLSYIRFAQKKLFKFINLDENIIKISGENAFSFFKRETGVHRVQRIPETERKSRIHTSTCIIVSLPQIVKSDIKINPSDLDWQFYRSGGHGGQNVNKVSTAVRLTHKPSGVVVTCFRERNQFQNRQIALSLLMGRLEQIEADKRQGVISAFTASAGHGERSEKIRTYNFPQNRLTDHRLNKSFHNLDRIITGDLDKVLKLF